jgi:hypothetical protein
MERKHFANIHASLNLIASWAAESADAVPPSTAATAAADFAFPLSFYCATSS